MIYEKVGKDTLYFSAADAASLCDSEDIRHKQEKALDKAKIIYLYGRLFPLVTPWFHNTFYVLFASAGSGIAISLSNFLMHSHKL